MLRYDGLGSGASRMFFRDWQGEAAWQLSGSSGEFGIGLGLVCGCGVG